MQDNTNFKFIKAGEIQIEQSRGKVKFYAWNHEHQEPRCIGSLIGSVYEKTAPILQKPEPSFCLPQAELAAIEQAGGEFIRFIGRGRPGTFSISLEDFKLHGEKYFNAAYGPQIRTALRWFAYSSKVAKRNPVTDNPVIATVRDIVQDRQLSLFG